MTGLHRIDVHHHILPPKYIAALTGIGITGGGGIPFPRWSAEEALGLMDRHAVQAAVTSISSPGVHFGDASAASDLARRCNEVSARLVSDHDHRRPRAVGRLRRGGAADARARQRTFHLPGAARTDRAGVR